MKKTDPQKTAANQQLSNSAPPKKIAFFERYLTLWVAICILFGIALGNLAGDSMTFLSQMEIAKVNIPIAILIWMMIYPMMMQIDFSSLKKVTQKPKGIVLTVIINWFIKPFTMAFFAWLFFHQTLYHGIFCLVVFLQYLQCVYLPGIGG